MREFLDGKLIGLQLRARRFLAQFAEEERGGHEFCGNYRYHCNIDGYCSNF